MLNALASVLAASFGVVLIFTGAATAGTSASEATGSCYADAVGDAGDAPDIARVTIRPFAATMEVDVEFAKPTEPGPYGWILVGFDTDRNPLTGGGRGDELLIFTNGDGTTLMRWADGRFTPDFVHRDFHATLTATDLTFTIARADLHARSFDFAVASLRQQADLAPGGGVARYPRRGPGRHGRSHAGACPVVTEQAARHVNRKGATRHADHCSTASASQCRAMSGDTSVTGS